MSSSATDVVGFCSKCGLVRQDTAEGIPVTDCKCTALLYHALECGYVKSVACPIDFDFRCKAHNLWPCEQCECTCRNKTGEGTTS